MSLYPNKNRELSSRSAANQYKFDGEMGISARFIYLMAYLLYNIKIADGTIMYLFH